MSSVFPALVHIQNTVCALFLSLTCEILDSDYCIDVLLRLIE